MSVVRSHLTMAKGVAVLSSSAGVSGTIYFTQEGDGKLNFSLLFIYGLYAAHLEIIRKKCIIWDCCFICVPQAQLQLPETSLDWHLDLMVSMFMPLVIQQTVACQLVNFTHIFYLVPLYNVIAKSKVDINKLVYALFQVI